MPVLVDIWAPWCPLCWRASPALDRLACTLAGQVKVVKINVARAPRLRHRFVVESVPTLMVLRGRQVVAYRAGEPPEPSLRAWLDHARQTVAINDDDRLGLLASLSSTRPTGMARRSAGRGEIDPLHRCLERHRTADCGGHSGSRRSHLYRAAV
jgi:thioredoxin-like negative regulator of GroEL